MSNKKTSYTGITPSVMALLWRNWAMAFGALVLPVVVGLFLPRVIMPLIVLGLAFAMRTLEQNEVPSWGCRLTLRNAMVALFWSTLVMAIINLLKSDSMYGAWFDSKGINPRLPFVSGMIIFPVTALVCLYELIIYRRQYFNREFNNSSKAMVGESTLGTFIYRESRYQLIVMLLTTASLAAVNTWYWIFYYIDINFNTPDFFFFLVLPLLAYLMTVVVMRTRYKSLETLLSTIDTGRNFANDTTMLRMLIMSGDHMMLVQNPMGKWDLPVEIELPHSHNKTSEEVINEYFERCVGIKPLEIKYIYTNQASADGLRFEHYAAFVDSEYSTSEKCGKIDGQWFTLDTIDRTMRAGGLAQMLMNEIYRIFTITMAWKTYDRNGIRLYPIKNYRPTFRLRDMRNWNVDYDDLRWLRVASENEDRPFFRIRRFIRTLFNRKSR